MFSEEERKETRMDEDVCQNWCGSGWISGCISAIESMGAPVEDTREDWIPPVKNVLSQLVTFTALAWGSNSMAPCAVHSSTGAGRSSHCIYQIKLIPANQIWIYNQKNMTDAFTLSSCDWILSLWFLSKKLM